MVPETEQVRVGGGAIVVEHLEVEDRLAVGRGDWRQRLVLLVLDLCLALYEQFIVLAVETDTVMIETG